MTIAVAADHHLETENAYRRTVQSGDDLSKAMYRIQAQPGKPIRLTKTVALPHRAGGAAERAARPVRAHPGPGPRVRRRPPVRGPAGLAGRPLASLRRRGGRAAGDPAGGPVEPLLRHPGRGPRRRLGHPGEGRQRLGVRRPLLLGHRDLRAPVPDLHQPVGRAERAAVPALAARVGPAAGPRPRPAGCAVPLAHDQRRGGVGVLRGRHRAVPHRRRRGLRAEPVRRGHRRRGLPQPGGHRHLRRDRAALGGPRLLAQGGRRDVPHPRGHRARTSTPPSSTTTSTRTCWRASTCAARRRRWRRSSENDPAAYTAMVRRVRLDEAEPVEWLRCARGDEHPVRRAPRRAPAGRALPRARDVGPRRTPR